MKLTLLFLLLLILLAACGRADDVGGPLPMVVTQWDDEVDGDALRWFTYSGYIESTPTPLLNEPDNLARIGDDFPVPRAMVAKMLSLSHTAPSTIESWAKYPTITFTDVHLDSWYFRYINAAYILGQMSGGRTTFRPNDMLTLQEAKLLMAALNPEGPGLYVTEENSNLPISYALWIDLFIHYLAAIDEDDSIKTAQIILLAHNAITEQIITNQGMFSAMGINMGIYLDRELKVLHRDGEILAMLGQISSKPTLLNVFVVNSDDIGLTIFTNGVTRNFLYSDEATPLPEGTIIANIQISSGTAILATPSETIIRGTIEQVGARSIVLREWGTLSLRAQFAVYSIIDNAVAARSAADLIVGANVADFHMIGGAIGAAVLTEIASPVYIRVLIGTCNFSGLIHSSVSITATGPFIVRSGETEQTLAAGEVFTVAEENRIYVHPKNPDDRLQIVGLTRNHPIPLFRGKMEIARAEGGLIIVNELLLEEYLYAVVPSEMPTYFGLEAAKVQAVTARTFAVHQFYENRFRAFGAHVDDSVISQVYNNIAENDTSREAVQATAGQVLTASGEIILANYFSTSSGMTANFGEVWAAGGTFPTDTPSHLTSRLQLNADDIEDRALRRAIQDLSIEENADLFFRTRDIPAFESHLPWFRWEVRMTAAELSQSVAASLATRQRATPSMIHTLDQAGVSTARPANSIGHITGLEITRRGQGGNVMEMIISGTEGKVRVQTEFNIRSLLAPLNATVSRADDSTVSNLGLLPSGFFTMEIETDASGALTAVTFYGGGHGHGVGMSQNGANALLNLGYSYLDVLRHYYPGVEVQVLD